MSTNGIRVNKEKVVSAELTHGDVVTIGKKLKFVYLNLYLSDVELKKYMTLISLQDHINEATGREIGLVSKKFCRSTDTAFKTQVIE